MPPYTFEAKLINITTTFKRGTQQKEHVSKPQFRASRVPGPGGNKMLPPHQNKNCSKDYFQKLTFKTWLSKPYQTFPDLTWPYFCVTLPDTSKKTMRSKWEQNAPTSASSKHCFQNLTFKISLSKPHFQWSEKKQCVEQRSIRGQVMSSEVGMVNVPTPSEVWMSF